MRYSISRQPPGLCICSRGSRRCAPCCSALIEPPKVLDQPATVSQRGEKISLSGNFRQAGNHEW